MCNAATTLMFESTPMYPDASRYWDLVERHKVTQFYTAPTAIRALMRFGTSWTKKHDLSSLRVLGTVGEPINPEVWHAPAWRDTSASDCRNSFLNVCLVVLLAAHAGLALVLHQCWKGQLRHCGHLLAN